jgi:hypothetical protein
MGREVRRVPATWEHPEDYRGGYMPLFDDDFLALSREWMDNALAWEAGTHPAAAEHKATHPFYWQWDGAPPNEDDYMPAWPASERTHYQMYETTSEGTPVSPVMESPEALARWLADNGASACGSQTASYDAWLRVCRGGYAPSMVLAGGRLMSGVEALGSGGVE